MDMLLAIIVGFFYEYLAYPLLCLVLFIFVLIFFNKKKYKISILTLIVLIFLIVIRIPIPSTSSSLVVKGKKFQGYTFEVTGHYMGIGFTKKVSVSSSSDSYEVSFPKKVIQNLSSSRLAYITVDINYRGDVRANNPVLRIDIRPARESDISYHHETINIKDDSVKEKFACAKNEYLAGGYRASEEHMTTYLTCRSKHLLDSSGHGTLAIKGEFNKLKKVELDFDIDDVVYCYGRRKGCPKYATKAYISDVEYALEVAVGNKKPKKKITYKLKKTADHRKQLIYSLSMEYDEYNLAKAEELLEQESFLVKSKGNRILQHWLAHNFARGDITFEGLKLLYKYGYHIPRDDKDIYVNEEREKLINEFDIEPSISHYYDFDELPKIIRDKLKEKNITLDNYYQTKKKRHGSDTLYEIASREDSVEVTQWLLEHGYKAEADDLERALVGALRYRRKVKNPSQLIKAYIKLGANLKNSKVAFPLIETMRNRLDDIEMLKTLVGAGVNINATDEYGSIVLSTLNYKAGRKYRSACTIEHNKNAIREYIKLGADINHVNNEGLSLIEKELRNHSICNVEALRELGATWKPEYDKLIRQTK